MDARMSTYLFTAEIVKSSITGPRSAYAGAFVCGENLDEARQCFKASLLKSPDCETALPTRIKRMVAAPVLEQVITESGFEPADWATIFEQIFQQTIERSKVDDFESDNA
jgi:hypothetical protein